MAQHIHRCDDALKVVFCPHEHGIHAIEDIEHGRQLICGAHPDRLFHRVFDCDGVGILVITLNQAQCERAERKNTYDLAAFHDRQLREAHLRHQLERVHCSCSGLDRNECLCFGQDAVDAVDEACATGWLGCFLRRASSSSTSEEMLRSEGRSPAADMGGSMRAPERASQIVAEPRGRDDLDRHLQRLEVRGLTQPVLLLPCRQGGPSGPGISSTASISGGQNRPQPDRLTWSPPVGAGRGTKIRTPCKPEGTLRTACRHLSLPTVLRALSF